MTGVDQSAVWRGEAAQARDHVIVENHHEPTTIHVKTYVDERYKLTVYYQPRLRRAVRSAGRPGRGTQPLGLTRATRR